MSRLSKILVIVIVLVILAVVAFVGFHFYISSGQLPLQLCSNCHGA